jgi:hypothetical protein
MKRSIQSTLGTALLALGTIATAGAANATGAYVYVNPQRVYEPPAQIVQVRPRPVYVARPAYEDDARYEHHRAWRRSCGAPAWEPLVRYMPGQTVWREGSLYVATGLSASVWNVNSPPEWTPNYWVPARCR